MAPTKHWLLTECQSAKVFFKLFKLWHCSPRLGLRLCFSSTDSAAASLAPAPSAQDAHYPQCTSIRVQMSRDDGRKVGRGDGCTAPLNFPCASRRYHRICRFHHLPHFPLFAAINDFPPGERTRDGVWWLVVRSRWGEGELRVCTGKSYPFL